MDEHIARVLKMLEEGKISAEQAEKLITGGKTDLLPKFISKKGRAFSAFLKLENGKIAFEFEKRPPARRRSALREKESAPKS